MKRLAIFLLAGVFSCSSVADAENVEKETINNWSVKTKINALTDKTEVVAVIDSNEDEDTALVVRCLDDMLDIYLSVDEELIESDEQEIAVRRDKGKVSNMQWSTGEDYTSAFVLDADVVPFAKTLLKTEKLVLGFEPQLTTKQVVTFDIKGFDKVYAKAASACGK